MCSHAENDGEGMNYWRTAAFIKRYPILYDSYKKNDFLANFFCISREVEDFLNSTEGKVGLELLEVTGKYIYLCEERFGNGFGYVFALSSEGFIKSEQAIGDWMAYAVSNEDLIPKISKAHVWEIVVAYYPDTIPEIGDIIKKIKIGLNEIAAEVLNRHKAGK